MKNVTIRTGIEGSKHNPNSYVEYQVKVGDTEHALRRGLHDTYTINGLKASFMAQAVIDFTEATGLSMRDLESRLEELYCPLDTCPCCGTITEQSSGLGDEPIVFCPNESCTDPYSWSYPEPWKFCV